MKVVASVPDGSDAAEVAAKECPDVVLMDYRLPNLDGVQATGAGKGGGPGGAPGTGAVKAACPEAAVVCLTASANLRERDALVEAGAVACLRKDDGLDAIVSAILAAAGRRAALWSSPPRTPRSSSTRRPISPKRPSASRTGGSCRCTSASAT